eukprot:9492578-Pyramimonas_sp.AAC.2
MSPNPQSWDHETPPGFLTHALSERMSYPQDVVALPVDAPVRSERGVVDAWEPAAVHVAPNKVAVRAALQAPQVGCTSRAGHDASPSGVGIGHRYSI